MQASTWRASVMRQCGARVAMVGALSVAMVIMLFGFVSASGASASLVHEWKCKPENKVWCYDPNGLANWHQGKVRLEKGYNAVLCARISKEKAGWAGESECTSTFEPVGSVEWWQWGTEWAAYDPLHASGLQANQTGNAEEIWNWFYEP